MKLKFGATLPFFNEHLKFTMNINFAVEYYNRTLFVFPKSVFIALKVLFVSTCAIF